MQDEETKALWEKSEQLPEHDARGKYWIGVYIQKGIMYQLYVDDNGKIWRDGSE